MMPTINAAACGAIAACAALLILTGALKLYRNRSARSADGSGGSSGGGGGSGASSVQRALRLKAGSWRAVQVGAGTLECATGIAVCAGWHPVAAGIVLAAQGVAFTGLLVYIRRTGIAGDCGCLKRAAATADHVVPMRAVLRACVLIAAGATEAAARIPAPGTQIVSGSVAGVDRATAAAVALVAFALLVSVDLEWRTPNCRRPLWFPRRRTAAELRMHGIYQAMAASAGPLADRAAYRRAGCVDEFRFPITDDEDRLVTFRVSRTRPADALTVRASIEAAAPVPTRAPEPGHGKLQEISPGTT
ncbi:MAG TPA: hypothetical protein VGM10_11290 [Actinocrinis sp.]|jgi:hypothetical protein